ncbi:winged helix-turn-helix domain-containing protein [Streptomyces sp. TRM66268-LWL]|uniref:Winged helix-turn-helix domain-containing protein n=1 Tax=Streptomyces polyasparticus TaxID=2767826 RepID=A0ABR7SU83_9ACTN|nr:BTAD domain-containing putative transcriptional regulator [Streptomyces polyasparticus]MBC9719062.1 winged helix-turn-helix domain-containing protein [Streptomyces polyasparticus]
MRYRILGITEATDDEGVPVPLGGARLRALLAALALRAGQTADVDALIDDVWAEDPPQDAPAALQALIGRLRRTLGKDAIASTPGGYRLTADPSDIDLHRFELLVQDGQSALDHDDPATAASTLREALTLWRGPALADLPDRTAAARPEAQRLEATRARIEADLRLGRGRELVPEVRELIGVHPYDEPLHAQLIRALRDAGRGADALAAYEDVRRTLAEGLGTDPGPELQALHTKLLTPAPAPTHAPAPAHTHAPAPTHAPPPPPEPTPRPDPPHRPTGNLRPRLTSFVGREPELAALHADLSQARLVTLTGPGGSGKTRLAEETAAGHPAPAWLAELAPLDHPEAVPGAVVSALGLRDTVLRTSDLSVTHDDPVELLTEFCADRELLLILDNCEHVVDAAARLAETLLTHCPKLRILATSREPLGVPGESVRPVEPLPEEPAHRLFAERAAAVRPGFDPERERAAVAEICTRLDGLPLAIELAAARLRLLTPRQIADRLDDRFRLLTSGSRTVLPRQQTLRAVVDWSWELLDAQERTFLREVSVFAGGWDLPAAEAVCGGDAAFLLGALVDKSLVVAAPSPGGMRYRMLETIHEYATERAAEEPAVLAGARKRHTDHFLGLMQQADPLLRTAEQLPWIDRVERDLDNLRAVLQHALTTGDEQTALDLCLAMGWFWSLRNYRSEGADWGARALAMGVDPTGPDGRPLGPEAEADPRYWPRMKVRLLQLFLLSDSVPGQPLDEPQARAELALLREVFGRSIPQSATFPGLLWPFAGFVLDGTGGGREAMETATEACRRYGGPWEVCVALLFRAHVAVDTRGGLGTVDEDLVQLRRLSRQVGDRWLKAHVCTAVGEAAMARGRFAEAQAEYEEGLHLAYEMGVYSEAPLLIARLAEIAYRAGDLPLARRAIAESDAEGERYGVLDTRAFVRLLSAYVALAEGNVELARSAWQASIDWAARATPPPQFDAGVAHADAKITALESGPAAALPKAVEGLRGALRDKCAEPVLALLAEAAATSLADLDDPRAPRILSAAAHWRGNLPTPDPDHTELLQVRTRLRDRLGDETYEREWSAGAGLTPEDVLGLLH